MSKTTDYDWTPPDGSRWLHVWPGVGGFDGMLPLAFQYESVGTRITGAPYILVTPDECKRILDHLAALPGSHRDDDGVSIRLDTE